MENYNYAYYLSIGSVVIFERIVRTELGFCLIYKLRKRKNTDAELCASDVYDIVITKCKDGASVCSVEDTTACTAELRAVSSVYDTALGYYQRLADNAVTPMCAYEVAEELLSESLG